MNKSLFKYVWRHSRREQLVIFIVVLVSLPFYYVSLDLPRRIVNEAIQGRAFQNGQETASFLAISLSWPGWLGGGETSFWPGFQVGRLQLLFGLSFLFLFFVLVNGWFKYWINVEKGALGERMMRRMRFELFSLALRFTPDALRTIKSSEAATIIKDEVEPIGGFIGDAFIQPVFLGTQASTALIFILLQNVWLGLMAGGVVGVQFIVIPRMRRDLLRLGRMRQIESRRLAGRIGEVIDGMEAVQVHHTSRWERAEIGQRLFHLFDIRFQIYKRKFIVKFLNNLLAQMTPFFFYAFGGYFALRGRLDIGQLVAVIAAYRELPPPLKELIDWDQQRLDVQVKYDQVVGYFASDKIIHRDDDAPEPDDEPLVGPLTASSLKAFDAYGNAVIDGAQFDIPLPASIHLVGAGGPGASTLARILAHRETGFSGEIRMGGHDLANLPRATVGRHIAYAGSEPILFPGSLRENLLYGLKRNPLGEPAQNEEEARRLLEAKRTGNPFESLDVDWTDLGQAGAKDPAELDDRLLDLLGRIGLEQDVYRFGLAGQIDPERNPALAEQIVDARERLRTKLEEDGMADLVEPFDPERYNTRATIAENLLFGVPKSRDLVGRALADHAGFREALGRAKLTDVLVELGAEIARTMTDIFRGVPSGHPLFDQFSFIHADELAEFDDVLKRVGVRGRGGPTRDDRNRLLALPLAYIEPRHRLGLIDEALQDKLVAARATVREILTRDGADEIDVYDPEKIAMAAPLRDNLLFGRVNESIADARELVRAAGAEVLAELNLKKDLERVGLDHQVGPAGRLLTSAQRASVNLIRCLVKRPDLLVVDGALAAFGEERVDAVLDLLMSETEGRTLVIVLPNDHHAGRFDVTMQFDGAALSVEDRRGPREQVTAAAAE